jgi:hypothetical protein
VHHRPIGSAPAIRRANQAICKNSDRAWIKAQTYP